MEIDSGRLTTRQAARLLGVSHSTVKRWVDDGLMSSVRTAGGHRRIDRSAIERWLRKEPAKSGENPVVANWIERMLDGRRYLVDEALLEARARLGSWYRVADEVGEALVELGKRWQAGRISVVEEHAASERLTRALYRVNDSLPNRVDGPRALLACAGDDEHTLGLFLAEICLQELGWSSVALGRRVPTNELVQAIERGSATLVVMSASSVAKDKKALAALARTVGAACRRAGVELVLGGSGAWPGKLQHGQRLTGFAAFHNFVAGLA